MKLKMKHETKNETLKSYVSLFEITDIQLLYNKKWNMKDKSKVLKTYGYMWDKLQFVCLIAVYVNADEHTYSSYKTPCAIMARATFIKPAMLAPLTKLIWPLDSVP